MPPSGYLPGAAAPAPMLSRFAQTAAVPPENFVGNLVFPDAQVDSFYGLAPIIGNSDMEAWDDDTVGNKTDFNEIVLSEGEYEWELGAHARKAIIGVQQIMKAQHARQMARGGGNTTADPVFDLEARFTRTLVAQNMRHNEILKIGQLLKTTPVVGSMSGNYPTSHVLPSIEIETTTVLRETLITASGLVEDAGFGPANAIIFGEGAIRGADLNPTMLDLLPPDAPRVITRDVLIPLLRLPTGQAQVLFATAKYKKRAKDAPVPMMNDHIWVGRIPQAGSPDGDVFGRNYWHPCLQNGQRLYVNRLIVGNQENRHIGVLNFYRPVVENGALGVLIPVTHAA